MDAKVATRRTQHERRKESRRKVLDAAMRLFASRGYSGTTMVEIGREAGVSHGLVTYHFGSKKQCIKAVLEDIRAKVADSYEGLFSSQRGLTSLDSVCERYLQGPSEARPGARAIYVAIMESISSAPDLKDLTKKNDEAFRGAIVRALTEAIEDGEISASVDVKTQAVLILGLLRGVVLQRMVNSNLIGLNTIIPAALAMVRSSLKEENRDRE